MATFNILIASTAIALGIVPAAAQQVPGGAAGAIAHFNHDHSSNARIIPSTSDLTLTLVSTRGNDTRSAAAAHFDRDHSGNDSRRADVATLYSGRPAYGAEIFARILEEGRGSDD